MTEAVLLFELAGRRMALPLGSVRECLPLPALRRRPGLPDAVAGFFALGDRVLPAIDLAVLLGLRDAPAGAADAGDPYRPLLLLDRAALLVDRAEGVATPEPAGSEPDPDHWQHGCVSAHPIVAGEPVALLDPARILLADEEARLAALGRDAASRSNGWSVAAADVV